MNTLSEEPFPDNQPETSQWVLFVGLLVLSIANRLNTIKFKAHHTIEELASGLLKCNKFPLGSVH